MLFLCELTAVPSEDLTWIKWVATTAMVVSLLVGVLWAVYLFKEIGSGRASTHDLNKLNARLEKVEQLLEDRVIKIYAKIEHQAELAAKGLAEESSRVTRTLLEMMQDLGEALALGKKGRGQ